MPDNTNNNQADQENNSYSQEELRENPKLHTIQRSSLKNNFFIMSRYAAQNKELSLEATGMLCFLLSLPEDWIIHKESLYKFKPNGRDKTRSAFNELIEHKFIFVQRLLQNNLKQGIKYYVFSEPYNENSEEFKKFLRHAGFQRVGNQRAENQTLQKIHKENTDIDKTYKNKESTKEKTEGKPSLASEDAHSSDKYEIKLKKEEKDKLIKLMGREETDSYIEDLYLHLKAVGRPTKYKSHYHTILSWYKKAHKQDKSNIKQTHIEWLKEKVQSIRTLEFNQTEAYDLITNKKVSLNDKNLRTIITEWYTIKN